MSASRNERAVVIRGGRDDAGKLGEEGARSNPSSTTGRKTSAQQGGRPAAATVGVFAESQLLAMVTRASQPELARGPTLLQSVSRGVQVLFLLAESDEGFTAKQTALGIGVPIATAYHLLNTLVSEGVVTKDAQRRYRLGSKLGVLADALARQLNVPAPLLSVLRALSESTGESAHLSDWRGGDIVILASMEGRQALRVSPLYVGQTGNAHARAAGKLLLALAPEQQLETYLASHPLVALTQKTIVDEAAFHAELARIRKRGYASDDEEFADGVACVAAPIIAGDSFFGVYSVSAPASRYRQKSKRLVEAVRAAAADAAGAEHVL